MSSPRRVLADALADALPDYRVTGHPASLDRVDTRTVMVWTNTLTPAGIGADRLTIALTVWVLTPHTSPSATDDDLDAALADVIGALHPLDAFAWTQAERDMYGDAWHGYRLDVLAVGQATLDPSPAVSETVAEPDIDPTDTDPEPVNPPLTPADPAPED